MKERIYLINLYDYYGNLLTEKQKTCFEDYYYNNLTLSEISENNKVSRSAVQKTLKEIESKLLYYEDNLRFVSKVNSIDSILDKSEYKEEVMKVLQS